VSWSLTVREEHKPRVFENRVLRRICELKRDGVTGGWRKLHDEELHNLCKARGDEVGGTCGTNGGEEECV
jgi:hypothetical protein